MCCHSKICYANSNGANFKTIVFFFNWEVVVFSKSGQLFFFFLKIGKWLFFSKSGHMHVEKCSHHYSILMLCHVGIY